MRVVADASALVDGILGTERGGRALARLEELQPELHAPSLCDVEVASALRGLGLAGHLSDRRLAEARDDYLALPLERHTHDALLGEILRLRHNFSAYDATYLALAVDLDAALLTTDDRLERAIEGTDDIDLDVVPL